jgi:hypothetical protein
MSHLDFSGQINRSELRVEADINPFADWQRKKTAVF